MTLRTVLLSLQALMAAAEPDDPQDAVVAKQFKENPETFRKTAKHWANIYAGCKSLEIVYIEKCFNKYMQVYYNCKDNLGQCYFNVSTVNPQELAN